MKTMTMTLLVTSVMYTSAEVIHAEINNGDGKIMRVRDILEQECISLEVGGRGYHLDEITDS